MKKTKTGLMLFSIGAFGYGFLELLWRGYTHWSMLGAGGICFVLFGTMGDKLKKAGFVIRGLVGSTVITTVEFIFGFIFNIILKKNVWDYSKMPFNIGGQVCILYSLLWGLLSIACIPFACFVKKRLQKKENMI